MGFLGELRQRYETAEREATAKSDELARVEAACIRGTATAGDREWAWFEAVMAQDRFESASRTLNAVAGTVGRMVDRARGFGG
jgi:hypothetical protein